MAKADQAQLDLMTDWLNKLEELLNDEDQTDSDVGRWVRKTFTQHRMDEHQRIVFGYQTLVENACEASLTYLDFSAEIKAAIAFYNQSQAAPVQSSSG